MMPPVEEDCGSLTLSPLTSGFGGGKRGPMRHFAVFTVAALHEARHRDSRRCLFTWERM